MRRHRNLPLTFCINATTICEMESYHFRYLVENFKYILTKSYFAHHHNDRRVCQVDVPNRRQPGVSTRNFNNTILSTEHGPRGGDEINKIKYN